MKQGKTVDLAQIEKDIYQNFELVQKIINNPKSIEKPSKKVKQLFLSVRQYKSYNPREGAIVAYKVFKINGYDPRFKNLTEIVINRLRSFSSLPIQNLSVI